jgi:hypothetical protein
VFYYAAGGLLVRLRAGHALFGLELMTVHSNDRIIRVQASNIGNYLHVPDESPPFEHLFRITISPAPGPEQDEWKAAVLRDWRGSPSEWQTVAEPIVAVARLHGGVTDRIDPAHRLCFFGYHATWAWIEAVRLGAIQCDGIDPETICSLQNRFRQFVEQQTRRVTDLVG